MTWDSNQTHKPRQLQDCKKRDFFFLNFYQQNNNTVKMLVDLSSLPMQANMFM